jgi:hypothetical protein
VTVLAHCWKLSKNEQKQTKNEKDGTHTSSIFKLSAGNQFLEALNQADHCGRMASSTRSPQAPKQRSS